MGPFRNYLPIIGENMQKLSSSLNAVEREINTIKGIINELRKTLNGIGPSDGGSISSADALLFIDNDNVISPGNGTYKGMAHEDNIIATNIIETSEPSEPKSISLQAAPKYTDGSGENSSPKFTVGGDDFTFIIGENAYTLTNILTMIEELRARTEAFRTNVVRNDVELTNGYQALNHNYIGTD